MNQNSGMDPATETINKFKPFSERNLFALTRKAGAINFYTQQLRPLTFVNEFRQLFKEKKTSIAIIGGGLAGITSLLSLNRFGFKNVTLFESRHDILCTHEFASHRHAHPHYNFWPLNQKPFSSATDLPFLNWFSETTDEIISQLKSDPELIELNRKIKCNHLIRKIIYKNNDATLESNTSEPSKFFLEWFDIKKDELITSSPFDVVILATGLGLEDNLNKSDSKNYWWHDHIREYRSTPHLFKEKKKYVVGTGDGGLIDFCRLAEIDVKTNNQSVTNKLKNLNRHLALELIAHLRSKNHKTLFPSEVSQSLSSEEEKLKDCFITTSNTAQVYQFNSEKFSTFITDTRIEDSTTNRFYEEYKKFLDNFRTPSRVSKLFLVGNDPKSEKYVNKIAPINLLIFEILNSVSDNDLLLEGKVEFSYETTSRAKIVYRKDAREDIIHHDDIIILRLGPRDLAPDFFSEKEKKRYHDFLDDPDARKKDSYFDLNWKDIDLLKYKDKKHLMNLISKYCETYFDHATPIPTNDNLTISLPDNEYNRDAYLKIGGFDTTLFGYNVSYIKQDNTISMGVRPPLEMANADQAS